MNLTMFDSTRVTDIPLVGADAVLGYTGGNWPTFKDLQNRFPHLPALGMAVSSWQDGQGLDIETGDATPADVPRWLDNHSQLHPKETPVLYYPASWANAVAAAAGGRRYYLRYSAHYGVGPHICSPKVCGFPQADATQWDDHGPAGEHYDRTLMSPAFLAALLPKVPLITRVVQASRSVVRAALPVRHNTGLATEKPWGAFPLPASDWYGLNDGTPHSHSGLNPNDHRAIMQIQRQVGCKPDGDFGPATASGVVAYQRRRKIVPADGAAGVHTWADMATHD